MTTKADDEGQDRVSPADFVRVINALVKDGVHGTVLKRLRTLKCPDEK